MNKHIMVLLAVVVSAGCGGREGMYDELLHSSGPLVSDGSMIFINTTTSRLISVDPDSLGVRSIPVCKEPTLIKTAGNGRVAVLCPEAARLDVVHAATLTKSEIKLAKGFDTLDVSPDGAYAVCRFSGGGATTSIYQNEYQIADLDAGEAFSASVVKDSMGISSVVFGNPVGEKQLAAFILDDGVMVIRLDSPSEGKSYKLEGMPVIVEALFSPVMNHLYLRPKPASGENNIIAINFDEPGSVEGSPNFLWRDGRGPTDILVLEESAGEDFEDRLLVVYAESGNAAILDAFSLGQNESVFEIPGNADSAAVITSGNRKLVVLYGLSNSILTLLDPAARKVTDSETLPGRVSRHPLAASGESPRMLSFILDAVYVGGTYYQSAIAVVYAEFLRGKYGLSVTPKPLQTLPAGIAFNSRGSRLFVDFSGFTSIVSIDVAGAGVSQEVKLDEQPGWLGTVRTENGEYVVALHNHPLGMMTVIGPDSFSRGKARELAGFLGAGLFDLKE